VKRSGFKNRGSGFGPRKEPIKQGTATLSRSTLNRSRMALKRSGPLKAGKKTLARRAALKSAIDGYFERTGLIEDGIPYAYCQLSGRKIRREEAIPHHKRTRAILRKEGVKNPDDPEHLLILDPWVHMELHGHQMGIPKDPILRERFMAVADCKANALNGLPCERRIV